MGRTLKWTLVENEAKKYSSDQNSLNCPSAYQVLEIVDH